MLLRLLRLGGGGSRTPPAGWPSAGGKFFVRFPILGLQNLKVCKVTFVSTCISCLSGGEGGGVYKKNPT